MDNRKSKSEFIFDSVKVHGLKYNYDKVEYVRNRDKVEILCEKHGSFHQSPKCHLRGQGCPKCAIEKNSNSKKYTWDELLSKFKQKHGEKFDYSKSDYKSSSEKIVVTCHKHGDYSISPSRHLLYGCKKCYNDIRGQSNKKNIEQFKEAAIKIHKGHYDYSNSIYVNSKTKIEIICPIHNSFFQCPSNHLSGQGCPKCNRSKGEQKICFFLKENGINYNEQFIFSDCRNINPLPFDFYLPDFNVCIEFDGHQHKAKDKKDSFYYNPQIIINDNIKNEYCKKNGIVLIRIPNTISKVDTLLIKNLKKLNMLTTDDKRKRFIDKSKQLWGYKYDYSKVDYIDNTTPVIIGYKGLWYKQTPSKHLQGKCIELQEKKMSNENFILKSKMVWGNDRFDYSECEYIGTNQKVRLYDKKKLKWVEQVAKSHLNGYEVNRFSVDDYVTMCNYIHDYKYTYNLDNYKSLGSIISVNCRLHGELKMKAASHLYGSLCPKCDESFFNKRVISLLKSLNLNFDRQKKFPDCRNVFELPFDFYISSMRTCIEFDGKQHFQPMEFFGGVEAFESLKINDKIKSDYCEDNYIDLIRIRYDQIDDIHQILWNNLKNKIKILGK